MKTMNKNRIKSALIIPLACAALAGAARAEPVWPNTVGQPMRHIMVSLDGNALSVSVDDGDAPVTMQRFPGQTYLGASSVLDGKAYSDQFGWLADGFIDPGAGNSVTIQLLTSTDGLETYEGGMRMMKATHTYNPIFGTGGSSDAWVWPGSMAHHWYAAADNGDYQATYRVFVSDASGAAVAGFSDAFVTLNFRAVPTPGAAGVFACAGLLASRRRRVVKP